MHWIDMMRIMNFKRAAIRERIEGIINTREIFVFYNKRNTLCQANRIERRGTGHVPCRYLTTHDENSNTKMRILSLSQVSLASGELLLIDSLPDLHTYVTLPAIKSHYSSSSSSARPGRPASHLHQIIQPTPYTHRQIEPQTSFEFHLVITLFLVQHQYN